jgi:hypothetical protein
VQRSERGQFVNKFIRKKLNLVRKTVSRQAVRHEVRNSLLQILRQEAGSDMAETLGNKTTFMRQPVLEDGAMWEGHHRCETYC